MCLFSQVNTSPSRVHRACILLPTFPLGWAPLCREVLHHVARCATVLVLNTDVPFYFISVWLLCLAVKYLLRSQIRITCSPPGHLMPHQEEFGLLASFSAIHPSHWRTGQAAVTEKPIIYCALNVPISASG